MCESIDLYGNNREQELAGALAFNEMVQRIMTDDAVYTYLIYFYLDEISDWRFTQEMEIAAEKGISEREYLSNYFSARIPGEKCYEKLIMKIEESESNP